MFRNIILSEKDYEYLTKAIAIGVGIGIIIGLILDNVILFFALGGVIGIIDAFIMWIITKLKNKSREL